MESPSFTEIQKFTQWWLWALFGALVLLPLYGLYRQVVLEEPFGNNPMSDWGLVLFLLGMLAVPGFFAFIELRTEIDERGIRMRLRPISQESFPWDRIEKVEPITYGFVGYGLRFSFKHGTVYNIRGNKGLAIYLKDGGRFVVGTQDPDRLVTTLKALGKL
ncbi:hypothetical protein [Robiginitalea marina]|uniref:Bacterial Pleckstrin homology domain-containing protein n=1 Tax=Robiginitalea marina TaxID=2954105 RepID=A0ABT1B1L3_9FLAO|nr:hypothetical protein [Robiginitalea marina]MCO5725750.1 hypothetical protein [Robiginitalea marina]